MFPHFLSNFKWHEQTDERYDGNNFFVCVFLLDSRSDVFLSLKNPCRIVKAVCSLSLCTLIVVLYPDEFLFDDIGSYNYLSNGNVEVAGIDDRSDLKDTLVCKYCYDSFFWHGIGDVIMIFMFVLFRLA